MLGVVLSVGVPTEWMTRSSQGISIGIVATEEAMLPVNRALSADIELVPVKI